MPSALIAVASSSHAWLSAWLIRTSWQTAVLIALSGSFS
jgi:hypothetical protein